MEPGRFIVEPSPLPILKKNSIILQDLHSYYWDCFKITMFTLVMKYFEIYAAGVLTRCPHLLSHLHTVACARR